MRILMLSEFYRPLLGGTERLVADLSQELSARGHTVAIATLAHPDAPAQEGENGVVIYRLAGLAQKSGLFFRDPQRRFTPPMPDPFLMRALDRLIAEWQPEIIHAHGWIVYSYLPLKRRRPIPLIVTLHDYGNFCPRRDLLHNGATLCTGPGPRKCFSCEARNVGPAKALVLSGGLTIGRRWHKSVDRFLAISHFVADQADGRVAPRNAIPIIPSFIADRVLHYQPPAARSPLLPEGDYLLYVGALGSHKGLDTLLEAYAGLSEAPPLLLIGSRLGTPPWGKGAPPSSLRVIHDAPHDLVLEAWAHCRIAVVPSRWAEPLGLVALEALAFGKPLVASRVGGLTDIVEDGHTGLLVPPGVPRALRAALATLLADPARGARLGAAGRQLVRERFTATAVVPQIEEQYAALLGSTKPARVFGSPVTVRDRNAS